MRKTKSRVSMLLIALLLGSLVTWAPTVSAEGTSSIPEHLQAQGINAQFDSISESTTVTWTSILTNDYPTMQQMQQSRYLLYRHNIPLNESVVAGLSPWANVSMCSGDISTCSGKTFQATYPLPAGTNGTYYYAIVTYFPNNDDMDSGNDYTFTINATTYSPITVGNFVHTESNFSEGVIELTNQITAPFFVQANYVANIGATDISWVNLNTIVPDTLPEVGESAYEINIYRHSLGAERNTWNSIAKDQIALLNAGETSFRYDVPVDTDADVFYSVTYTYLGYEDARFLGTNTLANSIHEDNVAPVAVTGIQAVFVAEPAGGTGNTTITWDDIETESGETYNIWRSGTPINSTIASGVELIGTANDGDGSYMHQVERGMLGLAYYAVTAADVNGNHNSVVSASAALQESDAIAEDTFTPWIAEPTNVVAQYLGGGQTQITWTDQIGVEGEQYHVWRAGFRLTSLTNLEENAELVATVPDSVETATVQIEDDLARTSYYCVSSMARYSMSSQPYEDLRFIQNCWGPIDEDTLRPSLPFLQDVYTTEQGDEKITVLRWVNDLTETGETYQIWRSDSDPFNGNSELLTGDISNESGWTPLLDPIVASDNVEATFTRVVPLPDDLDKNTWYAVTTTDQWGNTNTQYSMSMNARSVVEDTTPPQLTVEVENDEGEVVDSLRSGDYRLVIYSDEPLSEYPILNLRTSDYEVNEVGTIISGAAFTDQESIERVNPLQGSIANAYRYSFEITDDFDTSQIHATLISQDISGNIGVVDVIGWSIDSQLPTIEVYAPSQNSLYLYGESIHVYGAVTDDVLIETVEIKFQYKENNIQRETEWTAVTDLTTHSTDSNTLVFEWWEPAATFHDVGDQQRVYIRATDSSGNMREWFTQFTVDNCVRTILDYETACAGQEIFEPEPEPEAVEESMYEGVYFMVYALGGFNIILIIVAMMSVLLASPDRKKKGGDDDDEDDWMAEFMGGPGGGEAGSAADVRNDLASLNDDASEREEAEDPFAKSEGRERKRRTKKTKRKEKATEVVEESSDDEFDDEDDWDDEDDSPKESPKKTVRKRAVRRK